MENNWKVEFESAAGHNLATIEGYKNPVTMDLVTEDTFVHLALVEVEMGDAETQGMGCDVEPLSEMWDKAVVNSEIFGLDNVEVLKSQIDQDLITRAKNDAYQRLTEEEDTRRRQAPDIAGDVFG